MNNINQNYRKTQKWGYRTQEMITKEYFILKVRTKQERTHGE